MHEPIAALLLLLAHAGGCTMALDERGGVQAGVADGAAASGAPSAGASGSAAATSSRLLRLTSHQYDNCLQDLFGMPFSLGVNGLSDEFVGPFAANSVTPISTETAATYDRLADQATTTALDKILAMLPCSADAPGDEAKCVLGWVEGFAPRVYRRPLAQGEADVMVALFRDLRGRQNFSQSVRQVAATMLQSPYFLYRVEVGEAATAGAAVALTPYERASRLSFFLWGSAPDDELVTAAKQGKLANADGLEAQAQRMLASPRAVKMAQRFVRELLGVDDLASQVKDATQFPGFSTLDLQSMLQETDTFVEDWFRGSNDTVAGLLTAPYTFVDARLAALYKLPLPDPKAAGLQRVTLPKSSGRSGILTQGAFLARKAHADQTSLVRRGFFIRSTLICQVVPNPPPTVNNQIPPVKANQTTRQRNEQHRSDPACAGCHTMMDPLGYGFEQFDAVGQLRTQDGGQPIDLTGVIGGTDVDGPYTDAADEVRILAASETVRSCFVRQWFRFAMDRKEGDADEDFIAQLGKTFKEKQYRVGELLLAIARSNAMLYASR